VYGGPDWLWILPRLVLLTSLVAVIVSPLAVAVWARGRTRAVLLGLVAVSGLTPAAGLATLAWLALNFSGKASESAPAWADSFIGPTLLVTAAAMLASNAAAFWTLRRALHAGPDVPERVFRFHLVPYAAQATFAALFLVQEWVLGSFGPADLRPYVSSLSGVATLLCAEVVFLAVMAAPVGVLWALRRRDRVQPAAITAAARKDAP
jgi:hypothetical protein